MNIVTVKPNRASSVRRNDVGNAVILCLAGVLTRNLQKKMETYLIHLNYPKTINKKKVPNWLKMVENFPIQIDAYTTKYRYCT